MLYPGDHICSAEEYLAGFGVYSTEEDLRSANIGEVELDKKNHYATLNVKSRVVKMQSPGTVTIGVVANVSEKVAIVDLVDITSEKFKFATRGFSAVIPVTNVRPGFVKTMKECFSVGDIVRVKIVEVTSDSVRLTTEDKNLGVIKAYCNNCRKEIPAGGKFLKCENCGMTQPRKTAFDYGSGRVI